MSDRIAALLANEVDLGLTRTPLRFLLVDHDARPVAGPMGPLVVTMERGEALIEAGHGRELACTREWMASWGTVPEGGAAWKLVLRAWRKASSS